MEFRRRIQLTKRRILNPGERDIDFDALDDTVVDEDDDEIYDHDVGEKDGTHDGNGGSHSEITKKHHPQQKQNNEIKVVQDPSNHSSSSFHLSNPLLLEKKQHKRELEAFLNDTKKNVKYFAIPINSRHNSPSDKDDTHEVQLSPQPHRPNVLSILNEGSPAMGSPARRLSLTTKAIDSNSNSNNNSNYHYSDLHSSKVSNHQFDIVLDSLDVDVIAPTTSPRTPVLKQQSIISSRSISPISSRSTKSGTRFYPDIDIDGDDEEDEVEDEIYDDNEQYDNDRDDRTADQDYNENNESRFHPGSRVQHQTEISNDHTDDIKAKDNKKASTSNPKDSDGVMYPSLNDVEAIETPDCLNVFNKIDEEYRRRYLEYNGIQYDDSSTSRQQQQQQERSAPRGRRSSLPAGGTTTLSHNQHFYEERSVSSNNQSVDDMMIPAYGSNHSERFRDSSIDRSSFYPPTQLPQHLWTNDASGMLLNNNGNRGYPDNNYSLYRRPTDPLRRNSMHGGDIPIMNPPIHDPYGFLPNRNNRVGPTTNGSQYRSTTFWDSTSNNIRPVAPIRRASMTARESTTLHTQQFPPFVPSHNYQPIQPTLPPHAEYNPYADPNASSRRRLSFIDETTRVVDPLPNDYDRSLNVYKRNPARTTSDATDLTDLITSSHFSVSDHHSTSSIRSRTNIIFDNVRSAIAAKDVIEIEVSPGVFLPLHGSEETQQAMMEAVSQASNNNRNANNNRPNIGFIRCECLSCSTKLYCIAKAIAVVCCRCHEISPIASTSSAMNNTDTSSDTKHGIGLGISEQNYRDLEFEIIRMIRSKDYNTSRTGTRIHLIPLMATPTTSNQQRNQSSTRR